MSDTREKGVIGRVFYGKEDHGILTVNVEVNFGCAVQGFGNLCFKNKAEADDFIADLCAAFGVKKLEQLEGMECVAYRCFPFGNELIEALEAPTGRKFIITTWRRKHYPDSLDPLESRQEKLKSDIEFFERRIRETKASLKKLEKDYRAVEP